MEPQANGIKTWQWVVTVIVIIVLVILGFTLFKSSSSPATVTEEPTEIPTTLGTMDINRVVVSDQFPGNIVYISTVQLAKPGFVVIEKDNNGTPGAIIGSQYFGTGINPGKVTLTTPTVDGSIYYAVLYADDGDKKFDAKKDAPLKDSSGNIIMKLFHVSTNVTEVKG